MFCFAVSLSIWCRLVVLPAARVADEDVGLLKARGTLCGALV